MTTYNFAIYQDRDIKKEIARGTFKSSCTPEEAERFDDISDKAIQLARAFWTNGASSCIITTEDGQQIAEYTHEEY